ncbi:hypothetical protein [Actinomycetospora chlora]|uniref:hypothetical protein n=1 Tax=Actinomycetospora chlora TaxID=663608 RepID=UPI0031E6FC29
MIATVRVGVGLVTLVLALLAGCSTEYTEGTSAPPVRPAQSLDAARTKLQLVVQDPCYTARDIAGQWPYCGRWEEEVLNTANAAAGARPELREVTDPAGAVRAGHEHFVRGGCASGIPPAGPGDCVAAIVETREAVTSLGRGIAAAR